MKCGRRKEQVEQTIGEEDAYKGDGGIFSFFSNGGILGCLGFGKERENRELRERKECREEQYFFFFLVFLNKLLHYVLFTNYDFSFIE